MMDAKADKALACGTIIHGVKHSYRVDSVLRSDGQGFTYKTFTAVERAGRTIEVPMVVREQMMVRCSCRGDDGMSVLTPDDIAPTVDACLESFITSSRERAGISDECPWMINVIETFAANNTYYYVVEYLDGPTLEEYVESNGGRLTFEQMRMVISPIFEAVRTMHSHNTVHTDIHPRHVRFVNRENGMTPVLFSLYATMHFSDKGIRQWTLPVMTCEEGYAPPEQYRAIDHFCPQLDIYALAAMMVYALSGHTLPDSRALTEEKVREMLPPSVPERVVSALLNALSPDMSHRTPTISKFREDLGSFQGPSMPESSRPLIEKLSEGDEPTDSVWTFIVSNRAKFLIPAAVAAAVIAFLSVI